MVGLISYGAYIPFYRLKTSDIAAVWGKDSKAIIRSLGVVTKAVAGSDEDAVTLGFEAAKTALTRIGFDPQKIGSFFTGSETYPYAVNPIATTIGDFLGLGNNYFAADLEFACKAATTGLIITHSLIAAGKINYGLVVATDSAQVKPGDVLEYTASSAAASFVLGNKKNEIIAEILDYCSFSSDVPDFWRRDGISFPSHGGRFTGEPGYFYHILRAGQNLLTKTNLKPADFDYCVFHMPNNKFPQDVAKRLGFSKKQLELSLIVKEIGNPYSASALLGLVNVLDNAKPNKKIFLVSYGSGAGADAIYLETTNNLPRIRKKGLLLGKILQKKKDISYTYYLRMKKLIV